MKPAVSVAVSGRPIKEANLVNWANSEVQPLLQQLRDVVNYKGRERATATTDGAGTYIRAWTSIELPTEAAWNVSASVAGMSLAGVERAAYTVVGLVSSIAGTVTLTASTVLQAHETAAGIDARFGIAGRTVYLEVRDAASGVMTFVAVVETTEARLT